VILLPVQGIHIVLPMATPSQNVYQRWHWARRGEYRDTVQLLVRAAIGRLRLAQAPAPVRAVVRIIRYSKRTLDYGNLVGGAKPVLDALVREGVIHDDSPRWVHELYLQERARTGQITSIWVYPAVEQSPEP